MPAPWGPWLLLNQSVGHSWGVSGGTPASPGVEAPGGFPWGPEGREGRAPMGLSLQGLHHVPEQEPGGEVSPGGVPNMSPLGKGQLGALWGRGGRAPWEGVMLRSPQAGSGAGGGSGGAGEGRGAKWQHVGFWWAEREPKHRLSRGPGGASYQRRQKHRCFPAGCAPAPRGRIKGIMLLFVITEGEEKKEETSFARELC